MNENDLIVFVLLQVALVFAVAVAYTIRKAYEEARRKQDELWLARNRGELMEKLESFYEGNGDE